MSKTFVKELEASMDAFLSTSSDEDFLAALERADSGVYGKVDLPIFDMHEHILPDFDPLSTCTVELHFSHSLPSTLIGDVYKLVCEAPIGACQSDLALAA